MACEGHREKRKLSTGYPQVILLLRGYNIPNSIATLSTHARIEVLVGSGVVKKQRCCTETTELVMIARTSDSH
jgi:hypothetical protein